MSVSRALDRLVNSGVDEQSAHVAVDESSLRTIQVLDTKLEQYLPAEIWTFASLNDRAIPETISHPHPHPHPHSHPEPKPHPNVPEPKIFKVFRRNEKNSDKVRL